MTVFRRLLALVFFCCIPAFSVHADGLSLVIPFKRGQDIVSGFKLSGGQGQGSSESGSIGDPSWSPSFEKNPVELAPVRKQTPEEKRLVREIQRLKNRAKRLNRQRLVWQDSLERLQANEDYATELEDWAAESQEAQFEALQASLELLTAEAGPLLEAVDVHSGNATRLRQALLRHGDDLDEIQLLLKQVDLGRNDPAYTAYQALETAMRHEDEAAETFAEFQQIVDLLLRGISDFDRGTQLADAMNAHNYLLLAKAIEQVAVDILLEAGYETLQEELVRGGSSELARRLGLSAFFVNYGYQSVRFYTSWSHIHDLLGRLDNREALASALRWKISVTTGQLKTNKADLQMLEDAQRTGKGRRQAVEYVRQKDMKEAWRAGEWFSQQRGIRAPGAPILEQGDEL